MRVVPKGTRRRLSALGTIALTTLALGACGGDEGSEETERAPEEPTVSVSATALKDCLLSGSLDRGVYEEVPEPSPVMVDLAERSGAEIFEASKADEGLVYYFVFEEGAPDEAFTTELQSTLEAIAEPLQKVAGPKGLGEVSTVANGSVALALIPFSPSQTSELAEGSQADLQSCIDEVAA